MRVLKFGGKSLRSIEEIDRLAKKVSAFKEDRFLIVVSAMGDSTSNLIKMAELVGPNSPDSESQRELDMLLGSGERVSAALFSLALQKNGRKSQSFTGSQAGILTTGPHNNASIAEIKPIRIDECLRENIIPVVAGFQGIDPETKNITTLGRGGSDLTALFFAKHYNCKAELYKSAGGLFTADPNLASSAQPIKHITPSHLENICYWGTKALYTKAAQLALEHNVPLSFHSDLDFGKHTEVKPTKEVSFCVTLLDNIASVLCSQKSIAEGFQTLKKHFNSMHFRLLASAKDHNDSRFLLDFMNTPTEQLHFNEEVQPLNLNMKAVSFISSHNINEKQREDIMKSIKNFNVRRLLESKNRITFFIDSSDKSPFIKSLHKFIS